MNIGNYQDSVNNMPLYDDVVLGLAGEVGEVAELVKKDRRPEERRKPVNIGELTKEIGDVQWYLTRLASEYGISMVDVLETNINKLNKRHGQ